MGLFECNPQKGGQKIRIREEKEEEMGTITYRMHTDDTKKVMSKTKVVMRPMVDTMVGGVKTGERPQYGTGDTAAKARLLKQKTSQWESQREGSKKALQGKCQRQQKLAQQHPKTRGTTSGKGKVKDQTEGRERETRKNAPITGQVHAAR
ncbi:hypothetical protein B9Z19DRAFT_509662 [Tuber borchii]|uniref:Uncharacterized protein n=1 Tax=Tuber borchii TaxID=42251 RepID=A0A2T6ZE68_TUBBO|nr:hypothetical protein B9Z19DRAFT_509662 [Tuber borchii]